MCKFVIEPHFRLQEWVAEEKGYFREAGLDYEFRELVQSTGGAHHDKGDRVGAFQSFEKGRAADVSCACHWTVGVAASSGMGKLYPELYSVAPCGVFVPADSPVKSPEDLAGVPISVGYQSGSHYATIQALEQYVPADRINLSFADGMLFKRMEMLLDGNVPACTLFSGPYYLAEQLGFRKVIDATFMIATMIHGSPDPEDLRKYFSALRWAQRDIDLQARPIHPLLHARVPAALARGDGHAPVGPGRAPGVRAVYARDVRRDLPLDRRARHLRRHRHGLGQIRKLDCDGGVVAAAGCKDAGPSAQHGDASCFIAAQVTSG